jgi:hypothetical protein
MAGVGLVYTDSGRSGSVGLSDGAAGELRMAKVVDSYSRDALGRRSLGTCACCCTFSPLRLRSIGFRIGTDLICKI